jgi:F0F1-type ATP synthase alpha subunit
MRAAHSDVLKEIREKKTLPAPMKEKIREMMKQFTKTFKPAGAA